MNLNDFRNIKFKRRENCSICGKKVEETLLKLPKLPLTGIYVEERLEEGVGSLNQEFYLCDKCGHGQIINVIDPKVLYGESYVFRTSESCTAPAANDYFLDFINKTLNEKKLDLIAEVGCSDLYLLNSLEDRAERLVGIDPVLKKERSGRIEIVGDFVENVNFKEYSKLEKSAILCSHTLEHLEDPKRVIKKLVEEFNENSIFFFQFPSLDGLVEKNRFDQIFHQHLNYFSVESFNYLLTELGAELVAYDTNKDYWGSLLVAFKKGKKINLPERNISSDIFLEKYNNFKTKMKDINEQIKSSEMRTYGYGAGLMLPIISYNLGNNLSDWECIIDDDDKKRNLFYLNLPVKIETNEIKKQELKDSKVVITAIDNSRKILSRLEKYNPKQIILLKNSL